MPDASEQPKAAAARRSAVATAAAVLLLAACGSEPGQPLLPVHGVVADGPIAGSVVFLDLNGNLAPDEEEPVSSPTAADGSFFMHVGALTSAQLATAMFVAQVPATARDADDGGRTLGEAGRPPFFMSAPASAFIAIGPEGSALAAPVFISPVTTFVADEMQRNRLTLEQAAAAVRSQLALTGDPMSNFIHADDPDMRVKARQLADAFGRTAQAMAATQAENGTANAGQLFETIKRDLAAYVADVAPAPLPGVRAIGGVAVPVPLALPATAPVPPPSFVDYVVVLRADAAAGTASSALATAAAHGGVVKHRYSRAIHGFAVRLPSAAAEAFLDAIQHNASVDFVEPDIEAKAVSVQANATWGLDRSDQADLPLSTSYAYTTSGAGVRAYVIDTGILASHADFGGRVATGYSAVADGRGTGDCNGHGTHVAATIGGTAWGIAKDVTLVPIRVFDCTGSAPISNIIAGVDWLLADVRHPAVVNMSLASGKSLALDLAVSRMIAAGLAVAVAAGNSNANACNYSPAGVPGAMTVGATTNSDGRAYYSNYGSCLDLFAPGDMITSAWYLDDAATATLSGTSMAAPHVAGLSALILEALPAAAPSEVASAIIATATTGKVNNIDVSSPNRLIYTLGTAQNPPPPPPPVTNVSIANLAGSAAAEHGSWRATVTIAVADDKGNLIGGALVTGGFSIGGSSLGCTTGNNGTCSVTSGNIGRGTRETTYAVAGISGENMKYDTAANAATSITVNRARGSGDKLTGR